MGTAQPSRSTFVYFDGDDVGARIELHLLRNEVEAAGEISVAVARAVGSLADELRVRFACMIVFAAGDELLAVTPRRLTDGEIEVLRTSFDCQTGLSISCGVGFSAEEAALNLRLAKLQGKNRVCSLGAR